MAFEDDSGTVGITSTIPIEIPLAADVRVVDMNNRFITSPHPKELVHKAERAGLGFNLCGWVKGLFTIGMSELFEEIVVVDGGDCADLVALADFWTDKGIDVVYFNYPSGRDRGAMRDAMTRFMEHFEVTFEEVQKVASQLSEVRSRLHELDRLTWEEGRVAGWENHLYLVQSSDFGGDLDLFSWALDNFLEEARSRPTGWASRSNEGVDRPRIGYVGVPPIITDLYQNIDELGGTVVYNETQHQFTMPFESVNIIDQYLNYTYPYGGRARLEFIENEITRRKIDGIILYSENFCYKSIINTYIKTHLDLPVLEIEGKSPEPMDARTRLRLEAFIEMLGN
jgi:benzoyl-CoA reductase/2-hydroxyglutaryl-CoA dehydratase subunit BcrC/BadD/HgdB